jgi:uncharacterized protein (DUF58 family)
MRLLLDAVHDLETSLEASDYEAAALSLLRRQRRRCLVVLMTNLRDEESDELLPALRQLNDRHLVLLASTRESVLREMTEQAPANFEAALEIASSHAYLEDRRAVHRSVAGTGVLRCREPLPGRNRSMTPSQAPLSESRTQWSSSSSFTCRLASSTIFDWRFPGTAS